MEHPQPEGMAAPLAPYSPVVVHDDLVFVSGQVPFDESGNVVSDDFGAQAVQAFENLGRCLRAAGCDFTDLLKVNGFLADLGDFAAYNEVYRRYVAEPYPARTTVRADLVGVRVEIEAIARRPR